MLTRNICCEKNHWHSLKVQDYKEHEVIPGLEHIKVIILASNEKPELFFKVWNGYFHSMKDEGSGWSQDQNEIEMIKERIKTKVIILLISETKLDFFSPLNRCYADGFTSQFMFAWFYKSLDKSTFIEPILPYHLRRFQYSGVFETDLTYFHKSKFTVSKYILYKTGKKIVK